MEGMDVSKRIGKQTVALSNPPSVVAYSSIVGPKEGLGPLSRYFDNIIEDEMFGEKSWEKAESKIISSYMKYRGIVCFGAILGISVVVGACILGSKLKNKKDEEDYVVMMKNNEKDYLNS
jgi:hypothetical protein